MGRILYCVWSKVPSELEKAWANYIDNIHIPDLLKTEHFDIAHRLKVLDGTASGNYVVIYESPSKEEFDLYLKHDADRLRKDFVDHFGSKIVNTRTVLIQEFSSN